MRYLSILMFFLAALMPARGTPLAPQVPGLGPKDMTDLVSGAMVTAWPSKAADVRLLPRGAAGSRLAQLAEWDGATVLVESAFLYRGFRLGPTAMLDLVNSLLDIETLSGVTYYSERKNGIAVLFDEVYRVDVPGSTVRIRPSPLSSLPPVLDSTIHLKDSNFGRSWYALSLEQLPDGMVLSLQNHRPLSFMMVQAFPAAAVRMRVAVVPVDEGIYIAALCAADPSKVVSSFVDMYSAMEKRLTAVQGWVVSRLKGVTR